MILDLEKKLFPKRERDSTIQRENLIDEFLSDRSRIIYSSSFRRLTQKAQVFSLESNSSVRNRLTHSLEVADIGRSLAYKIGQELSDKNLIESKYILPIVTIIENACLIHDIGNPPFGHFGESAIQDWFKNKSKDIIEKNLNIENHEDYISDFLHFDGNPQGFRILNKLHCEKDKHGLNLTYPTMLCTIKYPRSSNETCKVNNKKAGYFKTEKDIVERAWEELEIKSNTRFPFLYIMEAADDICYCLSDIADSIEKGIIDSTLFKNHFSKFIKDNKLNYSLPDRKIEYFGMEISVNWSRKISQEVSEHFVANFDDYFAGEKKEIIEDINAGKILKELKAFARKYIYIAPEAQYIELSGYQIISGLLDHFSKLLIMNVNDFHKFIYDDDSGKGFDIEWRLYNLLSKRHIKNYKYENMKRKNDNEWLLRAHLITDYISGMTDQYALEVYQMLEGINIKRRR